MIEIDLKIRVMSTITQLKRIRFTYSTVPNSSQRTDLEMSCPKLSKLLYEHSNVFSAELNIKKKEDNLLPVTRVLNV